MSETPADETAPNDALATLVGFARTLRAAGVAATTDRVQLAVRALALLDPTLRDDVYWVGRATLCSHREDLERYDRVFAAYFAGHRPRLRPVTTSLTKAVVRTSGADPPAGETEERSDPAFAAASSVEVLRQRDFVALSPAERAVVDRLLDAFRLPGELRRTRRYHPARRGSIDRSRTVRELLRRGGQPARISHRARTRRPRPVVLLVDVSGSMSVYAGALLRFAHAAARQSALRTEVFTVGTRLTRVTDEMAHRDPDSALASVSATIPDWSGGTRLGPLVKDFLDRWGQRGLARGAVVVVLSDGWERGDPALLGDQMERLARLAHRVVWANPRKGREGYAPLVGGMMAALPHVDDFVEGHSVSALERLARVVAGAARAPAPRAAPVRVPKEVG